MKSAFYRLLLLVGLGLSGPALGAEITLFEHDGYAGRSFTSNESISNFANVGFNDRASSIVIRSGTWQLCSDAYFRGRCVTISRGEYPTLRSMQMEDRISSVRELDWVGGHGGGGSGGGVEIFDVSGFRGNPYRVSGTVTNFSDVGFNDRAQSMIVHDGNWEICEHADFRGACQVFGPGRYANLGGFAGRISSIRQTGGGGLGSGGGWGSTSRAILYEGANLSGRSFVINSEVASNLANTGFNDRAASLRVEAGYWVFCNDANFGGECMTFGPGDYPTLPWGLSSRISSGRRISSAYPYNQNPTWPR